MSELPERIKRRISVTNKERTDSQRLDALENPRVEIGFDAVDHKWIVWHMNDKQEGFGPTLRAAIDAYLDAKK